MQLTIDGGGQQRSDNLSLSLLVFVQETLETVEDCTAKHKRLSLIHHGHEQHHDGWSVDRRREISLLSDEFGRFNVLVHWLSLTWVGLKER